MNVRNETTARVRQVKVTSNVQMSQDIYLAKLNDPHICRTAQPGQFVMVEVPGKLLKRPLAVAWVEPEKDTFGLLYRIVGEGTKILSEICPDDILDIQGPLGNSFTTFPQPADTNVIITGGIGLAPGAWLASELSKVKDTHLLFGVRNESELNSLNAFPFPNKLKVHTSIEEKGEGTVLDLLQRTELPDDVNWSACGPVSMYQAIANRKPGLVSVTLEERMACGVGICYGCVVEMKNQAGFNRYQRVCCEGPVFWLHEVLL